MRDDVSNPAGLCLDIDGTLYRQGSAFVEAVASLAVRSRLFDGPARARLRRAVGTVGQFYGGECTRWRWELALRGLETLRRRSTVGTVTRALPLLRRVRERLDSALPTRETRTAPDERGAFQRRLLSQYARAIRGYSRPTLRGELERSLRELRPVDQPTVATLSRLAADGAELVLVTDMPAHVAEVYADVAIDASVASVHGTTFRTDHHGTFTGEFESIDKGSVALNLVSERDWGHTLAAGDTGRDAAMAPHVDVFLAVAGHGGVRRALTRLSGTSTVHYVPAGTPLSAALVEHCRAG